MTAAPPVTVLMPVYNGAEYLAEAIESILAQTLREFEFLIINDGSKDGSQEILERYAARDARIRLVRQDNMGLAATLNKGLALARGELVARQDQDDVSLPRRLEKQRAYLQTHPDCALLGTRATVWTDRTPTDRCHDHPEFNAVLKLDLLINNPFVHSSVMLRRSRVLEIGGYTTDRSRQPPEDYELWSRIARVARVANLPERLLVYREAAQSMSRAGVNPFQARLLVLSAENLALGSGLAEPDAACRDIAALFHQAPQALSAQPDLAAMESVLRRCGERIAPEAGSRQERREFQARCAFWMDNLRHHFRLQAAQRIALPPRPKTDGPRPTVTVLMPVFNGAAHVAEAIESILGQTLRAFEFLIIDDGSTDGTPAILQRYAQRDARIRVVRQENMGLAATLNKGLALATGELVARQDHDDLSAPDRLEHQLAYMEAYPDCVLLGTRASIAVDRAPTDRAHDHPVFNAVLKLDLLFDNPFVHSSVMLRRARVLELGGYSTDPARQPPEDYELWARIARVARVANLPARLLVYREVASSISRSGESPFQARLVALSSEHLALAAGLPVPDRHCVDIAALLHKAPQARSPRPELAAMRAVLRRCGERLAAEVASEEERLAFEARRAHWDKHLRHHYFAQVVLPDWARGSTLAGVRRARSLLRRARSLARKVVG